MNKDLPDIEKLFKSALEDNEEFPSAKVWDDIENILDKDDVIVIRRKYENLKRISFLLFFLLLGISIYQLNNWHSKANLTIINKKLNPDQKISSASADKRTDNSPDPNSKISLNSNTAAEEKNVSPLAHKNVSGHYFKINDYENYQGKNLKQLATGDTKRNKSAQNFDHADAINNADAIKSKENLFVKSPSPVEPKSVIIKDTAGTTKVIGLLKQNEKPIAVNEAKSMELSVKRKNNKNSSFSATVFFSPDFASYKLRDDQQNNQVEHAAEIEKNEHHQFSSTIGAAIDYRFKKHLIIESGLSFSNTNITLEPKMIYAQAVNSSDVKYRLNTSSGYGYVLPSFNRTPSVGDSLYIFTSTHTLQYVSLPVLIKFNIAYKKFDFNVMTGPALNFLIKGRIETSAENGIINEPEVVGSLYGLKKIYFSGLTGFSINYHLTDKIQISFSPGFRYSLNAINKNTPVKSFPNSFMLPVGFKIQL